MASEILTLQFGHYSNFIGAHWWNLQELGFKYDPNSPSEINNDVLFREGVTLNGEVTFTPRLLLVDLKGSLKALPEHGGLYSEPQTSDGESFEVRAEEIEEKNTFQKGLEEFGANHPKKIYDLDSEVRVWSDFLYTRFHPRTVNIVKKIQHSSDHTPFDIYPLGTDLWKSPQFSEDFSDKIRNYVEECDNFQGFHVLADSIDGFGGLSGSCMEYLRDEYDTKSILAFPVTPYINPESRTPIQLLNQALCFDSLREHSSLFVPLSTQTKQFNCVSYKPDFHYHSSAILAAALDTFTLSYRVKSSKHSLVDLCADLSVCGRKAAAASVCLPFPLNKNQDFIDCLDNWDGPLSKSLTPNCEIGLDGCLQLLVLRGIPESRLKRPLQSAAKQRDMPAYQCGSLKDMLGYYMACMGHGSRTEVTVTKEPVTVKTPYPKFFDSRVDRNGDIDSNLTERVDVESVKALGGLHTGTFVRGVFDNLSKELERVKYKQFHQYTDEGVDSDEFKECFNRILDLRDCYEDDHLI